LKKTKKQARKRIFCIADLLPTAFAAGGPPIAKAAKAGVLTYILSGKDALITACYFRATSEEVASAFAEIAGEGHTVAGIGGWAFLGCRKLTEIEIPDGVAGIGESAFYECAGLTSIHIPESVAGIGKYAFAYTGIEEICVPVSVAVMGASSGGPFASMSKLRMIAFKRGRTHIPAYALIGLLYKAVDVYVPMSVTSADPDAIDPPAMYSLPPGLTICGMAGSRIETWARGKGLPFKSADAWITKGGCENA
jgi:hypothetical protein